MALNNFSHLKWCLDPPDFQMTSKLMTENLEGEKGLESFGINTQDISELLI